jgi:peptidoglycan/xylan/chitin deacetylase (PgdA/CDA1 family)
MYLVKTPKFIPNLFPNFTWKIPTQEKVLYLTFDDGPVPEVTPWVLEQLEEYNAKATFFCVGENVQHHPDIFNRVTAAGHSVGSHTFNHLNGWVTDNVPYFHNVRYGAQLVGTELFRPPYGRIKRKQAQFLQRHYRIVMWDVLSGDFDNDLDANQVAQNVIQNAKPGSIVVFHDSLKAIRNLRKALPQVLKHFSDLGYRFEALNDRENITARKSSNQRELVAG